MGRPVGSRNTLVRLDYDSIGALVGIRGSSARSYANRGQYNSRDLDSLLSWVNRRRAAQGLPFIGIPDGDNPAVDTPAPVKASLLEDTRVRVMTGGLVYDPTTGTYRDDDHTG